MKPGAFVVLLLLFVLVGAGAGGAVGYTLHEPNPYADPAAKKSIGGVMIREFVGTETVEAAYEHSRRRWTAGGLAGGAVLGLLCSLAVGSYSLRHRNAGR